MAVICHIARFLSFLFPNFAKSTLYEVVGRRSMLPYGSMQAYVIFIIPVAAPKSKTDLCPYPEPAVAVNPLSKTVSNCGTTAWSRNTHRTSPETQHSARRILLLGLLSVLRSKPAVPRTKRIGMVSKQVGPSITMVQRISAPLVSPMSATKP